MNPYLLIGLSTLAGYVIGWWRQTKMRAWIATAVFAALATVAIVSGGIIAGHNRGDVYFETERNVLLASVCACMARGGSAGWLVFNRPVAAAVLSAFSSGFTLLIAAAIEITFACSWFGDCL